MLSLPRSIVFYKAKKMKSLIYNTIKDMII